MTPELYVISSLVVAVIVIAILAGSDAVGDSLEDAMKCPRCGAGMEDVGSGVGGCWEFYSVVPRILVLTCPNCGYSERSWAGAF